MCAVGGLGSQIWAKWRMREAFWYFILRRVFPDMFIYCIECVSKGRGGIEGFET